MSEPPRPSPEGESFEQAFERLRLKYQLKLREQIDTLDATLARARAKEPSHPVLEAAHQLAHRMKGTSGSYGFAESCAALEQIEEHLDALLGSAPRDPASIWAELEQSLVRARTGLG